MKKENKMAAVYQISSSKKHLLNKVSSTGSALSGHCLWPASPSPTPVRERCFMGRRVGGRRWHRKSVLVGDELGSSDPEKHGIEIVSCSGCLCVFPCSRLTLRAEVLSKVQLHWLLDIDRFLWSKANTRGSFLRPSAVSVPSLSSQSVVLIFISPHHVTFAQYRRTQSTQIHNHILLYFGLRHNQCMSQNCSNIY